QLGKARATLQWDPEIDDCRAGAENWFYLTAYTDPNRTDTYLHDRRREDGGRCFTLTPDLLGGRIAVNIATHRPAAPQLPGRPAPCLPPAAARGGPGAGPPARDGRAAAGERPPPAATPPA